MQEHSTNNTKHSKYKYTYYQNTQTYYRNTNTHTHTPAHISKLDKNNHSTSYTPNEIVTIQSSTSIRSD